MKHLDCLFYLCIPARVLCTSKGACTRRFNKGIKSFIMNRLSESAAGILEKVCLNVVLGEARSIAMLTNVLVLGPGGPGFDSG